MQEPDAPITWDQYANAMQVLRGHDACVRRVSRAAYGRATRVVERFRSEHNMSERGKVTPERVAALRAFGRQAVLGRQTPRGAVVRDLLSVIDELSQSVEDLVTVAEKDTDADGYITAYHFKTGALHRLLARTRALSPGVLQNVAASDELLHQREADIVDGEARRLDAPLVGDSGDTGCYARSGKRCEGYFSMGCRHCGRLIGSVRSQVPETPR